MSKITRGRPAVPDDLRPGLVPAGWTNNPGRLATVSKILRSRAAVPGDLGQGPKSRGVIQHSRTTRNRVRDTTKSTICPRRLGHVSQVPRD